MKDIHMNKTSQYLQSITPVSSSWAQKLEQYAIENRVPIIDRVSIQVLLQLIRIQTPKNILEIGTAIAYSTLRMHETLPSANIVTIEKNEQMYELAKRNIARYASNDHIDIIHGDAVEELERFRNDQLFDFVFIDAAKGQYEQYVKLIHPMLNEGAIIVSDNVLFREFVTREQHDVPKRFKSLVKKLTTFNEHMMNHEQYHSSMIPVGDGLLVSVKI